MFLRQVSLTGFFMCTMTGATKKESYEVMSTQLLFLDINDDGQETFISPFKTMNFPFALYPELL